MIICIAYCINAIIFPTCIEPSSTACAPFQTISTVTPFIRSIITGIIKVMHRFTNKLVLVSFALASSNRCSSCFSLLNARITGTPVKISLDTRFSSSIRNCSFVNFGMAILNNSATNSIITITAKARIHVMEASVWNTLYTPPSPRIGAYKTILNNMVNNI